MTRSGATDDERVEALFIGGVIAIVVVATVGVAAVGWLRDVLRDAHGLSVQVPRRDGIDPETIAAARRLTHR